MTGRNNPKLAENDWQEWPGHDSIYVCFMCSGVRVFSLRLAPGGKKLFTPIPTKTPNMK